MADPSSEILRNRAAKGLGILITLTPRVDPLIAELIAGSKIADVGVKNAMMKALQEAVSKAGANMSEASRNAILGLIDEDSSDQDGMIPRFLQYTRIGLTFDFFLKIRWPLQTHACLVPLLKYFLQQLRFHFSGMSPSVFSLIQVVLVFLTARP